MKKTSSATKREPAGKKDKEKPVKAKAVVPRKTAVKAPKSAAEKQTIKKLPKVPAAKSAAKKVTESSVSHAHVAESPQKPAAPLPPAETRASKTVVKPEPAKPKQEVRPAVIPEKKQEAPTPVQPAAAEEKKTAAEPPKAPALRINIPITVGAFAAALKVRPAELIKMLIDLGFFANINQLLNEAIVYKVAGKAGIRIEKIAEEAEKSLTVKPEADPSKLKFRPPVVTLMGHVDHGKTSLLDAIRNTNVASGEAGQITQHIGAYMVEIPGKGRVTFLDTPGHEAFTSIRARGANVTDVVVLVVAADDGVMPQTIEAINHARAAGCPIVVAVNKSDLPSANHQRIMTQLQKLELVPEEWGGKTICTKVSAKTGAGIDALLDMLLLEAEVLELKANPDCEAQGTVLEAKLTKGHGVVSTVLVQCGTLHVGDLVVAGPHYGRVRAMRSDRGKPVKEAGPSFAVEVQGFSGVPDAGEIFHVAVDEKTARRIAEKRALEIREHDMKGVHAKHLSLQELYSKMKEGQVKDLRLIIKADAQGSAEALTQMLERSISDKIKVRVIHSGVGGVTESDVMLAVASDAIVIGFHVKAEVRAQELIEKEGIDARYYSIIYEVVQDIQKAMEGLLEPTLKEVFEGRAEIRQTFKSSKVGTIGGAVVVKGRISRNHPARVIRDNIVVFEGKLSSLKRFKDDVRDVAEGYECGIAFSGFDDLRERDVVESYRLEKVAGSLV